MEHPKTPDEVARQIAANVNRALTEAGISQRSAAASTGIPLSTLSRRMTGSSPFLVTELAAIAELVGTSIVNLADLTDSSAAAPAVPAA